MDFICDCSLACLANLSTWNAYRLEDKGRKARGQDCSRHTSSKVAVLAQMPSVTVLTLILSA